MEEAKYFEWKGKKEEEYQERTNINKNNLQQRRK